MLASVLRGGRDSERLAGGGGRAGLNPTMKKGYACFLQLQYAAPIVDLTLVTFADIWWKQGARLLTFGFL